jgi:GGDEF domain-containing protein
MLKPKPIIIELKFGLIIGCIILISGVIGTITKWKEFYKLIAPTGNLLNWRFVIILLVFSIIIVWYIMNYLWSKEFAQHEITKKERDNLSEALKNSENERLTDVITGIPNNKSLEKDIQHISLGEFESKRQFILIDLKDFRSINNKYGFIKTNNLLRGIAQNIYKGMRRNEGMYKYADENEVTQFSKFYRIYPGGDEFAFLINGDQADAIGFANRLVFQFEKISKELTNKILGNYIEISFHCAIVEIDQRDSFTDIFKKANDCYRIAKEGKADFTVCWHPITYEKTLSIDSKKMAEYDRARQLFEVMTIHQSI